MVLTIVSAFLLVGVGKALFGAHVTITWLVLPFLIIGPTMFVSLGLLTGSVSKTESAAVIGNIITFPMMFLSGTFSPVSGFPPYLQNVAHALPLYLHHRGAQRGDPVQRRLRRVHERDYCPRRRRGVLRAHRAGVPLAGRIGRRSGGTALPGPTGPAFGRLKENGGWGAGNAVGRDPPRRERIELPGVGSARSPRRAQGRPPALLTTFPIVKVKLHLLPPAPPSVADSSVHRTPGATHSPEVPPDDATHDRRLVGAEAELAAFIRFLAPLKEAGKTRGGGAAALPPSLPFEPRTVRAFYESLPADLPVAVEFREPSWLSEESFALLKEFRHAYVVVDEPLLPVRLEVTAPFSYIRWHGHGPRLWYDYRYSDPQLAEWVPRVRALAERTEALYGFFNNHFRGDAAANGRSLSELLALPPAPWTRGRLMP